MGDLIQHHGFAVLVIGWLVTNAISTMPTPKDGGSQFYEWFFRFSQAIGGAIPRLLAIYSPATLTALTGQVAKTTIPPDPPRSASNTLDGHP